MIIIISRILIIAGDKQIVDDLLEFFESNGYEAEIALNTKIAINIMNERDMGIILIGFKDEESMNFSIIEEIREANKDIPIIVMGGEKSRRTENKIIKFGAQSFLPDPIIKDELLKEVKKVLG